MFAMLLEYFCPSCSFSMALITDPGHWVIVLRKHWDLGGSHALLSLCVMLMDVSGCSLGSAPGPWPLLLWGLTSWGCFTVIQEQPSLHPSVPVTSPPGPPFLTSTTPTFNTRRLESWRRTLNGVGDGEEEMTQCGNQEGEIIFLSWLKSVIYSGENKYLNPYRFRKFGHLQRNVWSIIVIVGVF